MGAEVVDGRGPVGPPMLEVEHLGLATRRGPVFADVSLRAWPGQLVLVVGRSGSGRSALLMALAGRLHGVTGAAAVAGLDLVSRPARARRRVSVARIGGVVELEPQLTVEESVLERSLTEGTPAREAERRFARSSTLTGFASEPRTLVDDLSRLDQARLALALACIRTSDLVVFDDVERDLDLGERRLLHASLRAVTGTGPVVVATTLDPDGAPPDALQLRLPATWPTEPLQET